MTTLAAKRAAFYGVPSATIGGAEDFEESMLLAAETAGVTAADVIAAADFIQSLVAGGSAGITVADVLKSSAFKRWKTAQFYSSVGTVSTVTASAGLLTLAPLWVPPGRGIDRLVMEATTSVATSVARFGVYSDDGNNVPSTLVYESPTPIDTATAGIFTETVALSNLRAGLYWVGSVNQTAASVWRSLIPIHTDAGATIGTHTFAWGTYYQASITAALPNPFVMGGSGAAVPRVFVRAV